MTNYKSFIFQINPDGLTYGDPANNKGFIIDPPNAGTANYPISGIAPDLQTATANNFVDYCNRVANFWVKWCNNKGFGNTSIVLGRTPLGDSNGVYELIVDVDDWFARTGASVDASGIAVIPIGANGGVNFKVIGYGELQQSCTTTG